MNRTNPLQEIKDLLKSLGYHESAIQDILPEIDTLFKEIDFDSHKQKARSSAEARDAAGMIDSLKDLMLQLENKGYYRPDHPTKLIRLLVNGLDLRKEDIFALLDKAGFSPEEKSKEKEFLASCAAITQLGYILLRCIAPEVKAASCGPHVFLILESFSPDSVIFVDFSIDSIREIDVLRYDRKDNFYTLKNTEGQDNETAGLLTQYYSSFHTLSGIGLCHNIHNNLGMAYDMLGRYEEAIAELHEALRLDPDYVEVHNNLAVAYSKMGKVEEATGELLEALRINPGYAIAHNNLGHIYALQQKNGEAIMEFHEALKLNPSYANARSNLGNIYAEMGRYEEAVREFALSLELDPGSAEAYRGLGLAYYDLGSFDRAAQALARAVYLEPCLLECVPEKLMLKVRQGVSRLR